MIITRDLTPDGMVSLWASGKNLTMHEDGLWADGDSNQFITEVSAELFGVPLDRGKKYRISSVEAIDD